MGTPLTLGMTPGGSVPGIQGVDWSALTEMGWFELHEEDPQTATAVLSEEVGAK